MSEPQSALPADELAAAMAIDSSRVAAANVNEATAKPLWMERFLTIEGYRRLKSGNWTFGGLALLGLGVLSDTAQLATTVFDAQAAGHPFLANLPYWGFSAAVAALVFVVAAIVSRSRLCTPCAGVLPHAVFAVLVFAMVISLQSAVLSEEQDPETGKTVYVDADGNRTETHSFLGELLDINIKIDALQSDVTDIKETTEDTNQRMQRLQEHLIPTLELVQANLELTEKNNVRLRGDLRGLLIAILEVDPDLPTSEILTKLPQAYELLKELRADFGSLKTIAAGEQEIATLLHQADQALAGTDGFSLETTASALREAREQYLAIIGERDEKQRQGKLNVAEIFGKEAQLAETRFDYACAADLNWQQLNQYIDVHGEDHPDTATSYDNVAFNLNAQGRYTEAEPLYRKALGISERVLGDDHPDTGTSYNNLASNMDAQGRYSEAEPLYRKALGGVIN